MTRGPFIQPVNGKLRVRVVVPPELVSIIGQASLTKALGTSDEREANRLAPPHIAHFHRIIELARLGGDWREKVAHFDRLPASQQAREGAFLLRGYD